MRKSKINLRIKSYLTTNLPIELFNIASITSPVNQRKQYNWDVTAQDFSAVTSVTMQYKTSASDAFSSKTVALPTKDTQGLLQALNSMGIGIFFSYTATGVLYISVLNDKIIYGSLDINVPFVPVVANGVFGAFAPLFAGNISGSTGDFTSSSMVFFVGNISPSFDHIIFRMVDSTASRPDKTSAPVPYVANTIMGTNLNPDAPFALPYWDILQLIGLNGAVETLISTVPTNLNDVRYTGPNYPGAIDFGTGDVTIPWNQVATGWESLGTAAGATIALNQAYLWDFNGISFSKLGDFVLSGNLSQVIGGAVGADAVGNFDPGQLDTTAVTLVNMTLTIPVLGVVQLSNIFLTCTTGTLPGAIYTGIFSQPQ